MPHPVLISVEAIRAASSLIEDQVEKTPIWKSARISQLASSWSHKSDTRTGNWGDLDIELFFKCENLQKTGSFKIRGATNLIRNLSDEKLKRGIVTWSTGNHALAISHAVYIASQERGFPIPSYVVMPETAPSVKIEGVRANGTTNVVLAGTSLAETIGVAERISRETGALLVRPDNFNIVVGQGTAAMEFLTQLESANEDPLDILMVPSSDSALAVSSGVYCEDFPLRVVACEPARGGADLIRGRREGQRVEEIDSSFVTIADGIRAVVAPSLWHLARDEQIIHEVYSATDDEIKMAMRIFIEDMHLLLEPCSAVPLAVMLFNRSFRRHLLQYKKSWRIGIIVTGGNTSLTKIAEIF
ncbi:tryptophan synthase beta subunit-like PLP-dependent enzyme [Stipitochalara longipes BDJ]|nr:tryptophan synthase beta subunit-like PLP-dependent enzyme [Stipitochalara longipes BDJ]